MGEEDPRPPLTPLTMAVLLALAAGDLHGYALLGELERISEGTLNPGTGTLYAALQRLLDEGLITESPDLPRPDEDQRRRYYRLTEVGRQAAARESRRMLRWVDVARERGIVTSTGSPR